MSLNIKNAKALQLAHLLSYKTGETITEAVIKALEERTRRVNGKCNMQIQLRKTLSEIAHRCAMLPDQDLRLSEKII